MKLWIEMRKFSVADKSYIISFTEDRLHSSYFAGSLNALGLLFVIPFVIKWDPVKKKFVLSSSKARKFICGLIHASCLSLFIASGCNLCLHSNEQLPSNVGLFKRLLFTLEYLFLLLFILAVMRTCWLQQKRIERFINSDSYIQTIVPKQKVCFVVFALVLMYSNMAFFNDYPNCLHPLFNPSAINKLQSSSAGCFLLEFIRILGMTLALLSSLFAYVGEAVCCTLTLSVWGICKNFSSKLKQDVGFSEGLKLYQEHKSTIDSVNSFASFMFLSNLLESLAYYTQAPLVYHFGNEDYKGKNTMTCDTIITLLIWGFGAECHALTRRTIRNWVNRRQEEANEKTPVHEQFQLASISQNLEFDPIALSCYFSNITYRFAASMMGLLISYNVIIIQMEDQRKQ